MEMEEIEIEGRKARLPRLEKVELGHELRKAIGFHARVQGEDLLAFLGNMIKAPESRAQVEGFLEHVNLKGEFKREDPELRRIMKERKVETPSGTSYHGVYYAMEKEYPEFLKRHSLQDSPEAYNTFYLAIHNEFVNSAKEFVAKVRENEKILKQVHPKVEEAVRKTIALGRISPYTTMYNISKHSSEGEPILFDSNQTYDPQAKHPLLEFIYWHGGKEVTGEPMANWVQRNFASIREAMRQRGLRPR